METIAASGREAFAALRASRAKRIALSAVLAVIAIWLQMLLAVDGQDDDWAMSIYLSGLYPDSGFTLFLNAALCGVVSKIFAMLPGGPNYYLISEIILSSLALMVVMYYSLGHLPGRIAVALISMFILFAVGYCTHWLNFTGVTCIMLSAGLIALFVQLFERRIAPLPTILGIAFIALASLFRMSAVLLCLPFALCLVVYAFAANRREIPKTALLCVPLCVACAICAGLAAYDNAQWQQSDWKSWQDNNTFRAELSDFPTKSYDEIADKLEAIGVSKNDYWLVQNWTTNDAGFFTVEKLREIAEIASAETPATPINMVKGLVQYCGRFVYHPFTLFALVAFFMIAIPGFRRRPGLEKAAVICALIITACVLAYFEMVGRLPVRIEYPIWLYCVVALALLLHDENRMPRSGAHAAEEKLGLAPVAGSLMALFLIAVTYAPAIATPDRSAIDALLLGRSESKSEMITYQKDHSDCVFAYSLDAMQERESFYVKRALPSKKATLTTQSLGGWSAGSPFLAKQLESYAGKDIGLFEAMAKQKNVMLVTVSPDYADHLLTYIREHYNPDAEATLVTEIHDSDVDADFKVYAFAR